MPLRHLQHPQSHPSVSVTPGAGLTCCLAKSSWRPVRGPVPGSAVPRSTRQQCPCSSRPAAHRSPCDSGSSGTDVVVRLRNAPTIFLPSSSMSPRMPRPRVCCGRRRPCIPHSRGNVAGADAIDTRVERTTSVDRPATSVGWCNFSGVVCGATPGADCATAGRRSPGLQRVICAVPARRHAAVAHLTQRLLCCPSVLRA
jgi:hypothetical protein